MSDDHISESPTPPRCPVCASGFTLSPGAACPACGRVGAPVAVPPRTFDLRHKAERFRLDGSGWVCAGVLLLLLASGLAFLSPGVLYFLGFLLIPALIRAGRLANGRFGDPAFSMAATFLAALGVSILMGVTAVAACFAVCLSVVDSGKGFFWTTGDRALVSGAITGVVVFVALFIAFWPRDRNSSRHDHGED